MEIMGWFKASYSNPSGDCVEVVRDGDKVHVRDSKNPDGTMLTFRPTEWDAFLAGVKAGEFDSPV